MADSKFTQAGFKYPERIYGHKFQFLPAQKPTLLNQSQNFADFNLLNTKSAD